MKSQSLIKSAVFLAVMLCGLSAGLSLSHVLEIPGKHLLAPSEFLKVHHTFYGGYAIFGALTWIYCIVVGIVAGSLYRQSSRSLSNNAFAGAAAFAVCLIIFALFLRHYNGMIATWNVPMPSGWQRIRNKWEASHVVVFVLTVFAFYAFLRAWANFHFSKVVHVVR